MPLFGSLMGDVEDDPFFGPHMRHMQHMNNFMNSIFSDPFGMLNDGPLAITGPRHGNALMPFMPQMPSLNRLFSADMASGPMSSGSSFSSSTVVMSSGPSGSPQVFSSTSSTKIGPNGVRETQKTLQDSRTGVKKMSIGHHIGDRAHVIEREQNYYSGDAEERQEFINLEEEEAEDFDREFQQRSGANNRARRALPPGRSPPVQRLALCPPPAHASRPTHIANPAHASHNTRPAHSNHTDKSGHATHTAPTAPAAHTATSSTGPESSRPGDSRVSRHRLSARKPLRPSHSATPVTDSYGVREVYGGPHPQRQKPRNRPYRNH